MESPLCSLCSLCPLWLNLVRLFRTQSKVLEQFHHGFIFEAEYDPKQSEHHNEHIVVQETGLRSAENNRTGARHPTHQIDKQIDHIAIPPARKRAGPLGEQRR